MKNWMVIFLSSWIASLAAAAGGEGSAGAAERPNILWLTVEDMSPTLGCWGDRYARTPNIDKLAAQSVKYSQAFATAPVCSPVRSCLITGCYATSLGTQRLRSAFPIPPAMKGFPAILRNAGYYCTNNVKTDYNTANEKAIIAASWDECSSTAHWRNRKKGQPFFAVFNDMTSHQSRTMAWPYEQFKAEVQSRLAPEEIHDPAKAPVPPYYPDTPIIRKTVARYYDCISVMDKNIGRLLKQIEEDGLAEDTIVFFFSDHGSGMPRHKRALLDTGMHVPLLVRFPKEFRGLAPAGPGRELDRLVSFVDFPASVLSLCGAEIPRYMQGVPFLGPRTGPARQTVFGARDRVDEAFDLARSAHTARYLYIRNYMPHLSYHQPSYWPDQGEIRPEITRFVQREGPNVSAALWHYAGPTRPLEELYDAASDPLNLNNLADSPQHQEVLNTMRRELHRWLLDSHDFGFLPEEEAWRRLEGDTPYQVAQDPSRYPELRLIDAASLVGRGPQMLGKLESLLRDDEPGVRYWAAVALAALGERAAPAEKILVQALEDPSPAVRIEAANALARAGEVDRALPPLVQCLESDDWNVVLHAARTIELLGDRARPALAAMQAALERAQGEGDPKMFVQFATKGFLDEMAKGAARRGPRP